VKELRDKQCIANDVKAAPRYLKYVCAGKIFGLVGFVACKISLVHKKHFLYSLHRKSSLVPKYQEPLTGQFANKRQLNRLCLGSLSLKTSLFAKAARRICLHFPKLACFLPIYRR